MSSEDKSYFVAWEWIDNHGTVKAVGDAIFESTGTLTSHKREDLYSEITRMGCVDECRLHIKTINLL